LGSGLHLGFEGTEPGHGPKTPDASVLQFTPIDSERESYFAKVTATAGTTARVPAIATIDKRINKGMLSEGIAERKIPHTEKPPEAWPWPRRGGFSITEFCSR
jgi:hypothetical protein